MLFQVGMYYLSFTPLWITIILMDAFNIYDKNSNLLTEYISIPVIIIVFIIALICVKRGLNPEHRDNVRLYEIEEVIEEKFLVAEFLMSFIFPLLAFDFTEYRGVIYFLIFFLIFGWLCYKHNYFCVNVVLEVMHYKIFNCKLKNRDGAKIEKKVLSKRLLKQYMGVNLKVKYINNEYMLDCYVQSDLNDGENH